MGTTAVRIALDEPDLPTFPFEVAPIADIPVRGVTRGATLARKKPGRGSQWARYRLRCRCGQARSIEAQLIGFSCTVLFDHPSCTCACGERCNGLTTLGWVVSVVGGGSRG